MDGAKWNKNLKKQKRYDFESDIYRVGILWSTGLDSTVLKEKLKEQRKELRITKLYCFFFSNANVRKGSNREREALERLKLKENYNHKYKRNFVDIVELDCPAPTKDTNLLKKADIHSFHGHNQWMIGKAVAYSIEKNFGINKFYYDVDCDNNDCFCDTEEAFQSFQTFINSFSNHSIALERFHCMENCNDFLEEKKQKIDYLKKLDLWESVSFCYSTRYPSHRAKSDQENGHFQDYACGQCRKCRDYKKALEL